MNILVVNVADNEYDSNGQIFLTLFEDVSMKFYNLNEICYAV